MDIKKNTKVKYGAWVRRPLLGEEGDPKDYVQEWFDTWADADHHLDVLYNNGVSSSYEKYRKKIIDLGDPPPEVDDEWLLDTMIERYLKTGIIEKEVGTLVVSVSPDELLDLLCERGDFDGYTDVRTTGNEELEFEIAVG